MNYKKINENISVSELGFGTWAVGAKIYDNITENDSFEAFDAYLAAGGNFIDTAESYGETETLLGEYLAKRPDKNKIVLASKTVDGEHADTVCNLKGKVEQSLRRLQRDYLDIFYLHFPSEEEDVMNESLEILDTLKKEGKILAIGASIKGPDVSDATIALSRKYIDTGKVDVIQLLYSAVRQKNQEIFEYAVQNNVALIGRTSLESGFLTGKFKADTVFGKNDHRARWNARIGTISNHVEKLQKTVYDSGWDDSLLSFAIRFAIEPEAITSTLIGAKSKKQMDGIMAAYDKGPLPKEAITYIAENFSNITTDFNTK